jgi:hypothetical protein
VAIKQEGVYVAEKINGKVTGNQGKSTGPWHNGALLHASWFLRNGGNHYLLSNYSFTIMWTFLFGPRHDPWWIFRNSEDGNIWLPRNYLLHITRSAFMVTMSRISRVTTSKWASTTEIWAGATRIAYARLVTRGLVRLPNHVQGRPTWPIGNRLGWQGPFLSEIFIMMSLVFSAFINVTKLRRIQVYIWVYKCTPISFGD